LNRLFGAPIRNHYWLWGPGDASGEVLVALDGDGERLRRGYARVERVADVGCTWCMPDVARLGVYVCREPRMPIGAWWPEVKRFL